VSLALSGLGLLPARVGPLQFTGGQTRGVVLALDDVLACPATYVLLGADLSQLVLDAHANRRAGVQGFETAGELVRVPVQLAGGELGVNSEPSERIAALAH
jgi:hypothetical protein